jgi:hypothetical protein
MKKVLAAAGIGAALTVGGLAGIGPAHAASFAICPSHHAGVIDGTPTSCPFADNIRAGWYANAGVNPFLVYSPVTEESYPVACVASVENVSGVVINGWTCYGGHDAEAVIW